MPLISVETFGRERAQELCVDCYPFPLAYPLPEEPMNAVTKAVFARASAHARRTLGPMWKE
jgi:hypothetical protein